MQTTAKLPEDEGQRRFLLDMIMQNSYPGESLRMSLSRLAEAAYKNGFEVLDPVAVIACYLMINDLSEIPYGK